MTSKSQAETLCRPAGNKEAMQPRSSSDGWETTPNSFTTSSEEAEGGSEDSETASATQHKEITGLHVWPGGPMKSNRPIVDNERILHVAVSDPRLVKKFFDGISPKSLEDRLDEARHVTQLVEESLKESESECNWEIGEGGT